MKSGLLVVNAGFPKDASTIEVESFLTKFLKKENQSTKAHLLSLLSIGGHEEKKEAPKLVPLVQKAQENATLSFAQQIEKEKKGLNGIFPGAEVAIGTLYGEPSIGDALKSLLKKDVTEISIISTYPLGEKKLRGDLLKEMTTIFIEEEKYPDVNMIHDYYKTPAFLESYLKKIKEISEREEVDSLCFAYGVLGEESSNYLKSCEDFTASVVAEIGDLPYKQSYYRLFKQGEKASNETSLILDAMRQEGKKKILLLTPGSIQEMDFSLLGLLEEAKSKFNEAQGEKLFTLVQGAEDVANNIKQVLVSIAEVPVSNNDSFVHTMLRPEEK